MVVPRNGCKPEATDNAPASSKASGKFQRGFVRRQTTTLQLQHFPIEVPAQFLTPLDTHVIAHRNNFLNKAKVAPPQSHHHTLPDNSTLRPAVSSSHPHCPYQVRQNQG
jgi:hypothetical protein